MKNTKMPNLIVIKIGGSTLGQHDTTLEDVVTLQKQGIKLVIVHGGGKIITDWLSKMGVKTQFVQGERVTDNTGLEIATGVLAGLVNKELVASISKLGGKALGISGVDANLIQGKIKNPQAGYVGEIIKVDTNLLTTLMKEGYIPVISSIGVNIYPVEGDPTLLLNINADIAAGEITSALKADKLIFLTDITGICDNSGKVISYLNKDEAEELITSGVATSGMIPKIRACIRALDEVDAARIIDGRQAHALLQEIKNGKGGTTIRRNLN